MAHKNIKAVVFDADGTLLDSREYIYQAFVHTLTTHGYEGSMLKRDDMRVFGGHSLVECYRAVAPQADHEFLCETHRAYQKTTTHLITQYEGVEEMLRTLRDAEVRIGVCTSRGVGVLDAFDKEGLTKYLDVVVHADMVSKHKPDPEGLLKALEELKVKPEHAAMVGDTSVDIETGKAAGVALTIGITHGLGTRESLQQAKPDDLVDHLVDIPSLVLG